MMDGIENLDDYNRNVTMLCNNVNSGFCECNGVGKFSTIGNSTFKKWVKMNAQHLSRQVPEGPNPLTQLLISGDVCQCAMRKWQVYLENQDKKRSHRADLCVKPELTAYELSAGLGSKNINTVSKLISEMEGAVVVNRSQTPIQEVRNDDDFDLRKLTVEEQSNLFAAHRKVEVLERAKILLEDMYQQHAKDIKCKLTQPVLSTDVKNVNIDENEKQQTIFKCDESSIDEDQVDSKSPNFDNELELFEQILSDHLKRYIDAPSIENLEDTFGTWHDMCYEDQDVHLGLVDVYCPIRATTERTWLRWINEGMRSLYKNISLGMVDIEPDTYNKGLLFMEDCKFNFQLFDMDNERRSSNFAFQQALRGYFKTYGYDSFVRVTIYKKYLQTLIMTKSRTVLSEQSYKIFVDKLLEFFHSDKMNKDVEPELQIIYNTAFVAMAHLQMYEFQNHLMGVVKRDIPDKIFKRT